MKPGAQTPHPQTEPEPMFHYGLQVWTIDGIVQTCSHPEQSRGPMRPHCCNQHRYAGWTITAALEAEMD